MDRLVQRSSVDFPLPLEPRITRRSPSATSMWMSFRASLDEIKDIGFKASTLAGLSFGITDMRIPTKKPEIIDAAQASVDKI